MSDQEQQDKFQEDEEAVEGHALDKKASDDDGDDVEAHALDKHR